MRRPSSRRPGRRQHGPLRVRRAERARHVSTHRQLHPDEEPAGGPNFWAFDPNVRYEIHIDNNGDGKQDVSYYVPIPDERQDRRNLPLPTVHVTTIGDPDQNLTARSTASPRTRRDDGRNIGSTVPVAPANVGPRSDPDYAAVANGAVTALEGRRLGLRRPARRSVLRRPRLDLRPRRAAPVQRVST